MFDPPLTKELTIKYLQFLGETADSLLTKDEILREDMDSLQREFQLFQKRVRESRFVPNDFKKRIESIPLNMRSPWWDRPFLRLFNVGDSDLPIGDSEWDGYNPFVARKKITAFCDELEEVLRGIERYNFWR